MRWSKLVRFLLRLFLFRRVIVKEFGKKTNEAGEKRSPPTAPAQTAPAQAAPAQTAPDAKAHQVNLVSWKAYPLRKTATRVNPKNRKQRKNPPFTRNSRKGEARTDARPARVKRRTHTTGLSAPLHRDDPTHGLGARATSAATSLRTGGSVSDHTLV